MRAAASSGSASRPAASASRNTSARCSEAARALLPADHREVRLVAVEPRHEHDAGLVEARRRLEDVARQRHGRREDRVEAARGRPARARRAPPRPPARSRRRCRAARRSVPASSPPISAAKLKSSPVYMRTPGGKPARASRSRVASSSSETLMPSTFAALRADDVEAHVGRAVEVARGPSSRRAPGRTCRRASAGSPARAPARGCGRRRARSRPASARRARARGSPSG